MPEAKSQIRDIFLRQVEALTRYAESDRQALLGEGANKFFEPDKGEWDGNVFDLEGLSAAFDREEIYQDFRATVTEDGYTTDLEITQLQGDFVAAMERAYRSRLCTAVRARCHAAARRRGHANPHGVLIKGLLGYLEHLKRLEGG